MCRNGNEAELGEDFLLNYGVYPSYTRVFPDLNTDQTFISSPLRQSWCGNMTLAKMNDFIDTSNGTFKQAVFKQKNRR